MVGDDMRRGISGGQKKRVTTGKPFKTMINESFNLIFNCLPYLFLPLQYHLFVKVLIHLLNIMNNDTSSRSNISFLDYLIELNMLTYRQIPFLDVAIVATF